MAARTEPLVIIGELIIQQRQDGSLGVMVDDDFCMSFSEIGDAFYELAAMEGTL